MNYTGDEQSPTYLQVVSNNINQIDQTKHDIPNDFITNDTNINDFQFCMATGRGMVTRKSKRCYRNLSPATQAMMNNNMKAIKQRKVQTLLVNKNNKLQLNQQSRKRHSKGRNKSKRRNGKMRGATPKPKNCYHESESDEDLVWMKCNDEKKQHNEHDGNTKNNSDPSPRKPPLPHQRSMSLENINVHRHKTDTAGWRRNKSSMSICCEMHRNNSQCCEHDQCRGTSSSAGNCGVRNEPNMERRFRQLDQNQSNVQKNGDDGDDDKNNDLEVKSFVHGNDGGGGSGTEVSGACDSGRSVASAAVAPVTLSRDSSNVNNGGGGINNCSSNGNGQSNAGGGGNNNGNNNNDANGGNGNNNNNNAGGGSNNNSNRNNNADGGNGNNNNNAGGGNSNNGNNRNNNSNNNNNAGGGDGNNGNGNNNNDGRIDDDGDEEMAEEDANGIVNEYKCDECENKYILNDPRWKDGTIRQFLVRYVCATCTNDIANNADIPNKDKQYTTMKCINEVGCAVHGKVWSGKYAERNWKNHYQKYHSTSEAFLKVTSQKLCEHQNCTRAIRIGRQYCLHHRGGQAVGGGIDGQFGLVNGPYCVIDGEGKLFDARDTMYLVDIKEDLVTDEQKDEMAKKFCSSFKKFSHMHDDYSQGLQGIIEMRMLMPAHHHIPFRDDNNKRKRETAHRAGLYKAKRYTALNNRIKSEQDRRNAKKDRQYENRKERRRREQQAQMDDNKMDEDQDSKEEEEKKTQEEVTVNAVLDASNTLQNDTRLEYNTNNIARSIDEFKYHDGETSAMIKQRIKRCCKLARKGKWKKANNALDSGVIVDLNKNGNWDKTKSKFPHRDEIKVDNSDVAPVWRLSEEKVLEMLKLINATSVGGPCGINNALLKWMAERDDTYKIARIFRHVAKVIVEKGIPQGIRDIMFFAKGLPLGKEKDGVVDFDVRPVLILDSWMRFVDRLITVNEDPEKMQEACGEFQVADMKAGCEVASISMEYCQDMITRIEGEAMAQSDAINAFNALDRQLSYNESKIQLTNMVNWFTACYKGPTKAEFDHNHKLEMVQGCIQGFSSSQKIYQMSKKKVVKKTEKMMEERHPNNFKVNYQNDMSDDGVQTMSYVYVPEYMELLIQNYKEWNIEIHHKKTNIVLKTTNQLIQQYIRSRMSNFQVNFEGNIEYLSIPHGTKEFVCQYVDELVKKLMIKLKHIESIKDRQIRTTLYMKFMNLNKVIYTLKNTKVYEEWIEKLGQVYDYIVQSTLSHINVPEVAEYQIPLSTSQGGLGMRNPRQYYHASRISTLNNKIDIIPRFFRFEKLSNGVNNIDDITEYNQVFAASQKKHKHQLEKYVTELNAFLSPDVLVLSDVTKHRQILKLIDKKYLKLFNEFGTDQDRARIRSLSTAGATSWLTVPANSFYGQKFTDLEYYVTMTLFIGGKLVQEKQYCKRCGQEMDEYGYHALSCPNGPYMIARHNGIRDVVVKVGRQAGMQVEIEQKYNREMEGLDMEDTDGDDPIHGIPGDIKIQNWFDRRDNKDLFGDIVVGNIFAPSYVTNTRKERLWLAKKKEKEKREKYNNPVDFVPMAIEVMGACGRDFKRILQQLADRIATRKNISYSYMINRIRTQITSYLMKKNAEMILASMAL